MILDAQPAKTVAIIGIGRAGTRFMRACLTADQTYGRLRIASVADRDAGKISRLANTGIVLAQDYRSTLDGTNFDLIIIATNDTEHATVLQHAKNEHKNFGRILCEKPLVSTRKEAAALAPIMNTNDVAVSFVERYSPAVEALHTFMKRTSRHAVRINFIWGRHYTSRRPTDSRARSQNQTVRSSRRSLHGP